MRAPSPVYNVDISPQVESAAGQAEAPVLRSGTATTLRFGIGPRWASSVTPGLSPNAVILTATSDLRLTAVLACSFCDSHEAFMRDVVYRPSARESNVDIIWTGPATGMVPIRHTAQVLTGLIDEACGRGSDESAKYGLDLFRKMNLQLLVATPLQKIHIIEPFVSAVGFVHNDGGSRSLLRNLTIEELRAERLKRAG